MSGLEWNDVKRPVYRFPYNEVSELKRLLSRCKNAKHSRTLFANHILCIHIEAADQYFDVCCNLVVNRDITFKHERDKTEILRLIRKYEEFKDKHNEFCESVNSTLKFNYLRKFYDKVFHFTPKDISNPKEY